jgi:hypothetical protein
MILSLSHPTIDYAQAMSAALWALAVPTATGTTRYAVGWIIHPQSGDVALSIPDTYTQRVAPDADIAAFVSALPIPQQEQDELAAVLEAARDSTLTVAELLPPTLQANALTDAEADAQGWFPEPEL